MRENVKCVANFSKKYLKIGVTTNSIDVNFNNIINKCLNYYNVVGDGMLQLCIAYIGQAWKHIKPEGGSEKK